MAIATTKTYNLTAQRLIDLALMDIGVAGQGGAAGANVDGNLRPQALDLLNILLKELDDLGMLLFNVTRRTQTLTAGTSSYLLANDVSDVDGPMRYTQSGATTASQVTVMARDEYMELPDRTIQGPVLRFYPEPSFDAAGIKQITLYLYPVPPNTGDTLEYAAGIRTADVTTLAQTIGIPQKWLNTILWGLGSRLAPSYNTPVDKMSWFNKRFETARDAAFEDDGERGPVQLVPFGQTYGYGAGGMPSGWR